MSRSPTSSHAAPSASTTASILTSLLFLCILSSVSAANPPPAPLPTLHNVVAAAAAAAPPPPRQHYNANRDAQQQQQQQQQPSGPYTPLVTPAPSALPDDRVLANQGFRQETYYTCMTAPSGREHCGWHTPVLKQAKQAGAVAAPGRATDARVVVVVIAALAGLFAVGMM
ncbi:hypothetical protein BM221_002231 [Beauveria bassiana]|uniref:Uncharacterized protein n=1 Tax=Beauveria bassiana TaxID=176275 RepID=A0A2N6NXY1_BEABA|nr:hypothetical protein BM221_002231 [Beauveria bassiana]